MVRQRREEICKLLNHQGKIDTEKLANDWNVQPITIRRDLEALEEKKLLIRVRGGAIRNDRVRLEFDYHERMEQNKAEKAAIAKRAAAMIQPGQTILIDTGTTTQLLARELVGRADLHIVTNSMIVAYELRGALGVEVVLLGGQARRRGFELIGPIPEKLLAGIHADIAFLGADAIDPDSGLYTPDMGGARIEELMIQSASKVVVLADASKIGRRALIRYARLEQVDALITCGKIAPTVRRKLKRKLTELIEVKPAKEK
jgi:DeoR/GlpR family transcriptional regulator of sugar metabolism